jgi:hypothetical protein
MKERTRRNGTRSRFASAAGMAIALAAACSAYAAPTMTISVAGSGERDTGPTFVTYIASKAEGTLHIAPQMPYLKLVETGGPIHPIRFTWQPFAWSFPTIQFTVDNPGDEPLALKAAVLQVRRSHLDPRPIPVIKPDSFRSNARRFELINEGWGEMEDLEIRFNLLARTPDGRPVIHAPPYRHTVKPGAIGDGINVDVSEALAVEGVRLKDLPGGRPSSEAVVATDAFGPFKDGSAEVVGEMRYQAAQPGGGRQPRAVKFQATVYLVNEHRVGVPAPPRYDYEARLEVEGRNYTVRVPIDVTVPARGRKMFGVRVGVDKSSQHEFTLQLESTRPSDTVAGPSVDLTVLIPRRGAQYVKAR